MSQSRLENLQKILADAKLDALALNPGASLFYLTGFHFHLMERPTVLIIPASGTPSLVLPALEMLKVEQMPIRVESIPFGDNPGLWPQSFEKAAALLGSGKKVIGIEPTCLRALEMGYLQQAFKGSEFRDASAQLSQSRACKDAGEISHIRKAVQIAEAALESTLPIVQAGVNEREISTELTLQLIRAGSDLTLAFQPIVSGGPNAANPHAEPSDRKLQPGDLLVIDWGAVHHCYVSDLTRTFAIGKVDPEYGKIVEVTARANEAGRNASRPGIPAGRIDRAARKVIVEAGYGDYFTHRTGHGIGLEGHEPPYIYGENELILQPGMVFTVEPGIYLPGRNGARIEDNVLITTEGAETLSSLERGLRVLG
ncbi:MAG: aminopeptidase P family protein [Anaerolineaceae bacterium]|nr:aminopeptidase P family protein [Anaerolineaceae bacterium]